MVRVSKTEAAIRVFLAILLFVLLLWFIRIHVYVM